MRAAPPSDQGRALSPPSEIPGVAGQAPPGQSWFRVEGAAADAEPTPERRPGAPPVTRLPVFFGVFWCALPGHRTLKTQWVRVCAVPTTLEATNPDLHEIEAQARRTVLKRRLDRRKVLSCRATPLPVPLVRHFT